MWEEQTDDSQTQNQWNNEQSYRAKKNVRTTINFRANLDHGHSNNSTLGHYVQTKF